MQPLVTKHLMTLDQIIDVAKDSIDKYSVEGVTLAGGEPTIQQNLDILVERFQSLGLGVILFTGRLYSELPPELIRHVDLVIDGRFEKEKLDSKRNIIGSTNQRIVHVTDRYPDDDWFTASGMDIVEIDVFDQTMIANGSNF